MSVKSDVVALLSAKKDEKVAAVAAEFDAMIAQIQDLPEDGDVAALQQQVSDLQAQLAEKDAELVSAKGLLSQADALAKQIDASIADAQV